MLRRAIARDGRIDLRRRKGCRLARGHLNLPATPSFVSPDAATHSVSLEAPRELLAVSTLPFASTRPISANLYLLCCFMWK